MSVQPTLGRILKDLRSHRGWTLKEMSERSGIPVSTLSKVEHDRLTLTYDKLLQLSQKLNIRISELFAESDQAEEGVTARRSIGREELPPDLVHLVVIRALGEHDGHLDDAVEVGPG